ncbi:uncharacterized protein LOC106170144 [Lingula anatina]|uniref:Uncharacterized protein LOC106170144 n=1 Tax=Lingula anatina TaxID=7574 RepID=A0A1S3J4H7_LINAN|nr:uncharacterized protein LOC106170144 [Lingula anatina]|eukprot:XP_013405342.1 uncharacterized protein LOC106170144 [Lingula anatina]
MSDMKPINSIFCSFLVCFMLNVVSGLNAIPRQPVSKENCQPILEYYDEGIGRCARCKAEYDYARNANVSIIKACEIFATACITHHCPSLCDPEVSTPSRPTEVPSTQAETVSGGPAASGQNITIPQSKACSRNEMLTMTHVLIFSAGFFGGLVLALAAVAVIIFLRRKKANVCGPRCHRRGHQRCRPQILAVTTDHQVPQSHEMTTPMIPVKEQTTPMMPVTEKNE